MAETQVELKRFWVEYIDKDSVHWFYYDQADTIQEVYRMIADIIDLGHEPVVRDYHPANCKERAERYKLLLFGRYQD